MYIASKLRICLLNFNLKSFKRVTTVQSSPLLVSNISTNVAAVEFSKRKAKFSESFPGIVDSLITDLVAKELVDSSQADVPQWIRKVLNYNVKNGKLLRGISTVLAYELMEKPDNINEESIYLSTVMGWCVEIAYFLILDDVMDGSEMRRGKPCWYKLPHVGLRAMNDSVLLYTSMHHLLEYHFGHLPQYRNIIRLINETMLLITIGQHLDYTASHRENKDYTLFTMELYKTVVEYKSTYTFLLPFSLGVLLTNKYNDKNFAKEKEICIKLGLLFQMQDDFIDVFKLETVTGKTAIDIREGKLTWLAVNALKLCNDEQRREFISSYGRSDVVHVEKIKELYKQLELPMLYKKDELKLYNEIVKLLENLDKPSRASEYFKFLLDIINERKQ